MKRILFKSEMEKKCNRKEKKSTEKQYIGTRKLLFWNIAGLKNKDKDIWSIIGKNILLV